ncbi:MAG: GerMN domain-containing protein [Bacillota bacterium]
MKKKSLSLVLLCVILTMSMVIFAGCGKDDGTKEPDGDTNVPKEQDYSVTLFFANEEYVAMGDESLEKFKVYQKDITSKPGEVYKDTLEELRTVPEAGYNTMIFDQIQFNDVYLEGDTIYVDLNSDGLNGGSLEETFLISQIVDTLINSFNEVKQVQFLVDGQPAESLMGHVDAADPFTEDLFSE